LASDAGFGPEPEIPSGGRLRVGCRARRAAAIRIMAGHEIQAVVTLRGHRMKPP
jgi:hypothetical protein